MSLRYVVLAGRYAGKNGISGYFLPILIPMVLILVRMILHTVYLSLPQDTSLGHP